MVQSWSLSRSAFSPALLSLIIEPMARPVRSRVAGLKRSRSTRKEERTTTLLTPALCAASTIARVDSEITDPFPPNVLITASAPSVARETADGSVAWPAMTRRLGLRRVSFSGERTSAVTVWPAASACSTTRRPVPPVAPRTTKFMGSAPSFHISKLKLQVGNLEELEASTYSRAGSRPVAATDPVAQQPRVERLASFDGHLHPVAGCDRFPVAARSRDDSLRVRCHGCPV